MNINKFITVLLVVSFSSLAFLDWVYIIPLCLSLVAICGLFYHETFKKDFDRLEEFKQEQKKVISEFERKVTTLENLTSKKIATKLINPNA